MQPLEWADARWEDPNGGSVYLHGTLPCIVYPREIRPRAKWDGLALLATEDEPQVWQEEAEAELEENAELVETGGISFPFKPILRVFISIVIVFGPRSFLALAMGGSDKFSNEKYF